MDIRFLLQGLLIGFSIAAPVGPIGVLCIRRTLAEGRVSGFVSGLGAATADALYGCIAGFGVTFISNILIRQQAWIRLIGGVFLLYFGLKILFPRPYKPVTPIRRNSLIGGYSSTFLLTLSNPMTIISFTGIFAGLGIGSSSGNYLSAGLLVLGVFMGSSLWWLILSSMVSVFEEKLYLTPLRWVNRISGSLIMVFGFLALLNLKRF